MIQNATQCDGPGCKAVKISGRDFESGAFLDQDRTWWHVIPPDMRSFDYCSTSCLLDGVREWRHLEEGSE